MYKNKKILALITARGKSRRLPGKNIKPLLGKPLTAWTIIQANRSRYIDKIIVSTDSLKIAKISNRYGAETPFLRPKRLATDKSSSTDVVLHAMKWLRDNGHGDYDLVMLLQPTSPLRLTEDIDKAIELLFSKNARSIVSVCKVEYGPHWMSILPPNGRMKDFINLEAVGKRRKINTDFYKINGAIYLAYYNYIRSRGGFFGDKTFAYIMPRERSIDIDDIFDFKIAEWVMKNGYKTLSR